MNKEIQFRKLFGLSSKLTDYYPAAGAAILDFIISVLLGNKLLSNYLDYSASRQVKKASTFGKFLIVSDLNIGDAVIATCALSVLKHLFPESEIDLVAKDISECFLSGHPQISNLYPVFNGAPYPSEDDLSILRTISNSKDYDLIFNFSPLIQEKSFGKSNVINYQLLASELIRNENSDGNVNNICYLSQNFIKKVFHNFLKSDFNVKFAGAQIYLSNDAIWKAENFLMRRKIFDGRPLIMINPDASAKYTRIPFNLQVNLLKQLSDTNAAVLLGAGHVEKFIEKKIFSALPSVYREKITIVPPDTRLDVYTALIDKSDIFITGDTGPLHLAAARKYSRENGRSLRNKTAVFSVFGSTPPKVYGYDSIKPGFLPANQNAPSRVFVSQSPCRNITCINKTAKTCGEVRCFETIKTESIVFEAKRFLNTITTNTNRNLKREPVFSFNNLITTAKPN